MVKNIRIHLFIDGVNSVLLRDIFDKVISLGLEYNLIRGYDEVNDDMPEFEKHSEGISWYLENYNFKKGYNRQNSIHFFQKRFLNDMSDMYRFAIRTLPNGGCQIFFESQEPDLDLTKFHYYEQFFYNLYRSLPGQVSYKSFVNLHGSSRKFFRENGLLDINYYSDPLLENDFFYRIITPKSIYMPWHTKEQLLNAPFYSIKEVENEALEIIQFEKPFSQENKKQIDELRNMMIYLSQNNVYPDEYK